MLMLWRRRGTASPAASLQQQELELERVQARWLVRMTRACLQAVAAAAAWAVWLWGAPPQLDQAHRVLLPSLALVPAGHLPQRVAGPAALAVLVPRLPLALQSPVGCLLVGRQAL